MTVDIRILLIVSMALPTNFPIEGWKWSSLNVAPILRRDAASVPGSSPVAIAISEWQDLNLRPPRPERGRVPGPV